MRETIEKARQAQQQHEQKHDVQLEICAQGISAPCGLPKGHKSRHLFHNEHVTMTWKNEEQ